MMETALRQLCYAVLCLPVDVPSSTLKTAMEAVASDEIQYPKNYRRFLFYYTGHGRPNTICTPDGNVELKCITDPLEKISDQSEEPIPIVLIFDSCSVGMLHSARNTLVISASLPDSVAYASTGQCGLLTEYLAPALTDPAHSNSTLEEITTHVTKEVTKVLKKHKKSAVRQGSTPVVFSRHLQETIRPQQERTKASKFLFYCHLRFITSMMLITDYNSYDRYAKFYILFLGPWLILTQNMYVQFSVRKTIITIVYSLIPQAFLASYPGHTPPKERVVFACT